MYKINSVLRLTTSAVSEDKEYTRRLKGFTVSVESIETVYPPLKLGVTIVTGTLRVANNEGRLLGTGDIITHVNGTPVRTVAEARAALVVGENSIRYVPAHGTTVAYASPIIHTEPPIIKYHVRVLTPEWCAGTIYTVCEDMLKPLTDNSELLGKLAGSQDFAVANGTAYIRGYTIPTELPDGQYMPRFLSVVPISDVPKLSEHNTTSNPVDSLVAINISDLVKAAKFCLVDRGYSVTNKDAALSHIHLSEGNIDAANGYVGTRITADTGDIIGAMIPADEVKTLSQLGERIIYMCVSDIDAGTRMYGILDTGATFTYHVTEKYPDGFEMIVTSESREIKDYSGYVIPDGQQKYVPKKYTSLRLHDGGAGSAAKILYFGVNNTEIIFTTCLLKEIDE